MKELLEFLKLEYESWRRRTTQVECNLFTISIHFFCSWTFHRPTPSKYDLFPVTMNVRYSLFYSYLFTSEKLSLGETGRREPHNSLYFRKEKSKWRIFHTCLIMLCFLMYASETFYSKLNDCMTEVVYLTRNSENKIWDLNLLVNYRLGVTPAPISITDNERSFWTTPWPMTEVNQALTPQVPLTVSLEECELVLPCRHTQTYA